MGFTKEKAEIENALNSIAQIINNMESTSDKAVFLNDVWADIDRFNNAVKEHEHYVSRETLLRFFDKNSRYNDYLQLSQQEGSLWDVFYFGVPLCKVSVDSGVAVFYSMDSINEETERVLDNMQTDIRQHESYLASVRQMAGRNTFTLFIKEMLTGLASLSQVREFRNHMNGVADEVSAQIIQMREVLSDATKNKEAFVDSINTIATYLYAGFEKDGYDCQLEDIEKMKYDFKASLLEYPARHEYRGSGIAVKESESCVAIEKLTVD